MRKISLLALSAFILTAFGCSSNPCAEAIDATCDTCNQWCGRTPNEECTGEDEVIAECVANNPQGMCDALNGQATSSYVSLANCMGVEP